VHRECGGGGRGGGGRGRAGEWGATKWISQGSQRAHEDAVRMPLQHDIKRTGREGPRAPVKPSQARPGQARPSQARPGQARTPGRGSRTTNSSAHVDLPRSIRSAIRSRPTLTLRNRGDNGTGMGGGFWGGRGGIGGLGEKGGRGCARTNCG
jgi:hypothetical protein